MTASTPPLAEVPADPHRPGPSEPPLELAHAFGATPAACGILGLLLLSGTAMATGLGLHEPGMALAPVLLGAAATVSSRRVIGMMAVLAVATSVMLHARSPDWQAAGAPTLWAQWWIIAGSQLLGLCAGWGMGRLIERRIRLIARAHAQQESSAPLPEIPVAVLIVRDGIVLQSNWAAARLLGCASALDTVGFSLTIEPPGTGSPLHQVRTTDGRWLSITRSGQWVRHGGLPAELVCLHDEEPRRHAEEAARSASLTLSAVVEGHPCGMVLSDLETTRVMLVNKSFSETVGLSLESIRGAPLRSLGIWNDVRQLDEWIQLVRARARSVEQVLMLRRPDGQLRRVRARLSRIHLEDRPALLAVAYDITEEDDRASVDQALPTGAEPVPVS